MNLHGLEPGDVVEIDHKGRLFFCLVEAIDAQQLKVKPLDRHNTWRTATAKEVIGIWRASKATRARRTQPHASIDPGDREDTALVA